MAVKKVKKKILIAAGGTGGHIYPALALARQLSDQPNFEVSFVGGNLATNRYFDPCEHSFHSTSCGSFSKNPFKLLSALGKIGKGLWQSHRAIAHFKPDVAVGFGSYYTFPALVAALLHRIPVVLHEANSIPGKVNRLLSRYATVTGVHFPDAATQMRGQTAIVGMPLRPGFRKDVVSKKEALKYFELEEGRPTLLVFGGSQGANSLNQIVARSLCSQIGQQLQVIHITGNAHFAKYTSYEYLHAHVQACVKEFETRMDLAWQAADLVISRAGAGTISEAIEFEVPAILIPFPRAADNHQEKNADFMVKTVGGAEKVLERYLTSPGLSSKLTDWLHNHCAKLHTFRTRIAAYKRAAKSANLIDVIRHILQEE